jgi:hypothetical protein
VTIYLVSASISERPDQIPEAAGTEPGVNFRFEEEPPDQPVALPPLIVLLTLRTDQPSASWFEVEYSLQGSAGAVRFQTPDDADPIETKKLLYLWPSGATYHRLIINLAFRVNLHRAGWGVYRVHCTIGRHLHSDLPVSITGPSG